MVTLRDIAVVSWDVDGTLYATRRAALHLGLAVHRGVLHGHGGRVCRELLALRRHKARVDAARRQGGDVAALMRRADLEALRGLEERWYGPAIAAAGPRPGLTQVLGFIADRGIQQVALSDYRAGYKLDGLGLRPFFSRVFAGEDMGYVKPSPEPFRRMVEALGVRPHQVLHIGDRVDQDGAGALAAGYQVAVLGREFADFPALLRMLHGPARTAATL